MPLKQNGMLRTPDWIISKLGVIDLDPCAHVLTDIGTVNYRLEDGINGLEMEWQGFVFCNPPFSQKEAWIEKVITHGNGILLLPERGSAPWFGPLAQAAGKYFVMGKKINFLGGTSSNNVGSVFFPFGSEALCRVLSSGLPGPLVSVQFFKSR